MPAPQKARREWSSPNELSAIQWIVPPIILEHGGAQSQAPLLESETVDQYTELLETYMAALTTDDGSSPAVQAALLSCHLPPSWLLRVYSKFCATSD